MSFIKFLANCSPFSIGGYVKDVGCVVFGKFGGVFMIAPDTTYIKGSLIIVGSDGGRVDLYESQQWREGL